eukprot:305984-Pyramimonas_sp.AAC.1
MDFVLVSLPDLSLLEPALLGCAGLGIRPAPYGVLQRLDYSAAGACPARCCMSEPSSEQGWCVGILPSEVLRRWMQDGPLHCLPRQ